MALSDLQVFQEEVQTQYTEEQDQQVEVFNGATRGGVTLIPRAHEGDVSTYSFWQKISGLVRRRNAYGNGAVSAVDLAQAANSMVKVAAGTPPVNIDPGMLKWIQKDPTEAGVVIGAQMAGDSMADMLNVGVAAFVSAVGNVASNLHDGTAAVASMGGLMTGASKFGDAQQDIVCWLMHSKSAFDIYAESLTNSNRLFQFGNVMVTQDHLGKPIIITDSPALITAGLPTYHQLGLAAGAVMVHQGNEFTSNIETSNGDENILRTYQAEWVYQLGLKGFTWDYAGGGASPNDAALGTAANWDQTATSRKDLAGVMVNSL